MFSGDWERGLNIFVVSVSSPNQKEELPTTMFLISPTWMMGFSEGKCPT